MMSGIPRATYDDVKLLLQLYDVRREDRLREARRWFAASFKVKTLDAFNALCPPGSEPSASYRMVTTYWEMVASFMTSGVLSQELFFESGRIVEEGDPETIFKNPSNERTKRFLANFRK